MKIKFSILIASIVVLALILSSLNDNAHSAVQHTVVGAIWAAWNLAPYHAAEPAEGAMVTVINLATHEEWYTTVGSSGIYSVVVTHPGDYKIEACGEFDCYPFPHVPVPFEFYGQEFFTIPSSQTSISVSFNMYYGSYGINHPNSISGDASKP